MDVLTINENAPSNQVEFGREGDSHIGIAMPGIIFGWGGTFFLIYAVISLVTHPIKVPIFAILFYVFFTLIWCLIACAFTFAFIMLEYSVQYISVEQNRLIKFTTLGRREIKKRSFDLAKVTNLRMETKSYKPRHGKRHYKSNILIDHEDTSIVLMHGLTEKQALQVDNFLHPRLVKASSQS